MTDDQKTLIDYVVKAAAKELYAQMTKDLTGAIGDLRREIKDDVNGIYSRIDGQRRWRTGTWLTVVGLIGSYIGLAALFMR
jgi:hypothetical protein